MIYLFLYLANITTGAKIIAFVLSTMSFFAFVFYMDCEREFDKMAKRILISSIIFGFVGMLIPTDKCLYQIGAVYVGKEVVKNERVNETLTKVQTVINAQLDKQIQQLQDNKNE